VSKDFKLYEIKVTNLRTKAVYIHNKVPYEHVEMLKLNPNLEIDIMGENREKQNGLYKTLQKGYCSINI
jgi:hypothetical protein